MAELHTVDVEKRLREKSDDFVLKQHLSAKSDIWKHFSSVGRTVRLRLNEDIIEAVELLRWGCVREY